VPDDALPPDVFLAAYPDDIRAPANRLRALVRAAVPDAIERVRPGWRIVGYDIPIGRRRRYFAFVAPEPKHVHIGFEFGISMADPDGMLLGAHLKLRQVRFLTFRPGQAIPESAVIEFVKDAARVAVLPREAREALASGGDGR
jgi:hypothetical protein